MPIAARQLMPRSDFRHCDDARRRDERFDAADASFLFSMPADTLLPPPPRFSAADVLISPLPPLTVLMTLPRCDARRALVAPPMPMFRSPSHHAEATLPFFFAARCRRRYFARRPRRRHEAAAPPLRAPAAERRLPLASFSIRLRDASPPCRRARRAFYAAIAATPIFVHALILSSARAMPRCRR